MAGYLISVSCGDAARGYHKAFAATTSWIYRVHIVGKPYLGITSRLPVQVRLVFTDEAAHRQCRSGWMTRYRKLSDSELSPSVPR